MARYNPCYKQLRPTTWKSCKCSHAVRPLHEALARYGGSMVALILEGRL